MKRWVALALAVAVPLCAAGSAMALQVTTDLLADGGAVIRAIPAEYDLAAEGQPVVFRSDILITGDSRRFWRLCVTLRTAAPVDVQSLTFDTPSGRYTFTGLHSGDYLTLEDGVYTETLQVVFGRSSRGFAERLIGDASGPVTMTLTGRQTLVVDLSGGAYDQLRLMAETLYSLCGEDALSDVGGTPMMAAEDEPAKETKLDSEDTAAPVDSPDGAEAQQWPEKEAAEDATDGGSAPLVDPAAPGFPVIPFVTTWLATDDEP